MNTIDELKGNVREIFHIINDSKNTDDSIDAKMKEISYYIDIRNWYYNESGLYGEYCMTVCHRDRIYDVYFNVNKHNKLVVKTARAY